MYEWRNKGLAISVISVVDVGERSTSERLPAAVAPVLIESSGPGRSVGQLG